MTNLIEGLKERQKSAGMNQEAFADHLGISQSMLSRLYAGKRDVGIRTFQQIMKVYPELAFVFLSENIHLDKTVSI